MFSFRVQQIIVVLFFACLPVWTRADETADVKAAAKAYQDAVVNGDIAAAKKLAITDANSEEFISNQIAFRQAQKKLMNAAVEKFGEEGKNVWFGGNLEEPARQLIDEATVNVDGDKATLTIANMPRGIHLKREEGQWKMDFTALDAKTQATLRRFSRTFAPSMEQTAEEIKGGKYSTVAEAKQALQKKIAQARAKEKQQQPAGGEK